MTAGLDALLKLYFRLSFNNKEIVFLHLVVVSKGRLHSRHCILTFSRYFDVFLKCMMIKPSFHSFLFSWVALILLRRRRAQQRFLKQPLAEATDCLAGSCGSSQPWPGDNVQHIMMLTTRTTAGDNSPVWAASSQCHTPPFNQWMLVWKPCRLEWQLLPAGC